MLDDMVAFMNHSVLFSLLLSTSAVYASFAFSYGNLSGGNLDALQSACEEFKKFEKATKKISHMIIWLLLALLLIQLKVCKMK